MPYVTLSMLITALAALRFENAELARFACMAALGLVAADQARRGLLGSSLQIVAVYAPIWKVFASGIALFMIGVVVDLVAPASELSAATRSIFGPLGFATMIAAIAIALHRKGHPDDEI